MGAFLIHSAHLERAKKLLDGDEYSCIYACLELRLAIEEHVKNKLRFYSKRYGTKLLYKHWQPNKAIKILCQLEPDAGRSYALRIGDEDDQRSLKEGVTFLGKHEALSAAWVNKNYNKMGYYLHKQDESYFDVEKFRKYLRNIVDELERIEKSTLISDFGVRVNFDCNVCGEKVVISEQALSGLEIVYCQNLHCNATFAPRNEEEKGWLFELVTTDFKCEDCGEITSILSNELNIGARISCKSCGSKFKIVSLNWLFDRV